MVLLLVFYDNGQVKFGTLAYKQIINGIYYPANYNIEFNKDGSLLENVNTEATDSDEEQRFSNQSITKTILLEEDTTIKVFNELRGSGFDIMTYRAGTYLSFYTN